MSIITQVVNKFITIEKEIVFTKINKFIKDGPEKLHLILDFDRTLTINKNKKEDITTWQIIKDHLPTKGLQKYHSLYDLYRPKERNNALTLKEAKKWWEGALKLYIKYKVDLNEVEKDFFTKISMRPKTKELFSLCKHMGIPTVILSAGIKDVIDLWAKTYSIKPSLVLSTKLKCNSKGIIVGWEKNSLIHILNKKEIGHPELTKIRQSRLNTILVGDSLEDADMTEGDENVLRIRIKDKRLDDKKTFNRFDLMIVNKSLNPIIEIIKLIQF